MNLWEHEEPVKTYDPYFTEGTLTVPNWIEGDICPNQVAAICQGGCDSGAYMPAVTYWQALETMTAHGDDVLQYLEDTLGWLPTPTKGASWAGMACFYLSQAVELWAASVQPHLARIEVPEE